MSIRAQLGVAVAVLVVACAKRDAAPQEDAVVATFTGGQVTRSEVEREGARLPPLLKSQFESPAGRKELAQSLADKRLLVAEALRRGYEARPEIRKQVDELRDRLVVQALLAEEERKLPSVTDAEERAFFEAHQAEFNQPERLHLARILFRAPARSAADVARARARAEAAARKLRGGAKLAAVATAGEGPERDHGGDYGLFGKGDLHNAAAEAAVFALHKAGAATEALRIAEGYAVFVLLERFPARAASFEEVRPQIRSRIDPARRRKVFDDLIAQLRRSGALAIDEGKLK